MRKIQTGRVLFVASGFVGAPTLGLLASHTGPLALSLSALGLFSFAGLALLYANRDCPRCGRRQAPRGVSESRAVTVLGFECPACGLRV